MIEVINQFYSMNLATETVKGMRENAERGYCNGGRVPYGYRLERVGGGGGREHSRLVLGPEEEVAVVREMFDMATNHGMGGKRIANALNSRGIPAPASKHWNASTVHSMLNNRAYVGDRVWMRSRKKGRDGRALTPEDDWIVAEDAHEPLVDRALFERRKALAAKRRFNAKRAKGQPVQYLLGRLIRCGRCGNNYVGRMQRATTKAGPVKYYRYYCGGYLSKGKSVCPPHYINRDWIEGLVLDLLRQRICSADAQTKLEARVRERIEARRQSYGADPKAIAQKLDDLQRRIDNYYRAIGEGMDTQVCQQHIAELTEKKVAVEQEAGVLRQEDYYELSLEKNLATLRRFTEAFKTGFDELPFATRRQIVLHFVRSIEVVDHKMLRIRFQVPFDNNGIRVLTDEDSKESGEDGAGPDVSSCYPVVSSNYAGRPTTGSQH
jgi:site-specific DNA recombinase